MKRTAGVSLIEVLVAVLVMSVGVLGVAGLQSRSLQNNRAAFLHLQAAQLADDMMGRIRANSGDSAIALFYDGLAFGDAPPAAADCAAVECTAEQLAVFDQAAWKCQLGAFAESAVCAALRRADALVPTAEQRGLPEGDGEISVDGASGLVRIRVGWRERDGQRAITIESRI